MSRDFTIPDQHALSPFLIPPHFFPSLSLSVSSSSHLSIMTILPPELLQLIISFIDPFSDRQTLLSLLRVSTSCWDAAARSLYRTVTLQPKHFPQLFTPPHLPCSDPAGRVRRSLSFVHNLQFLGEFEWEERECMWSWAQPHIPLFPNVRTFALTTFQGDRYRTSRPAPPDVVIFDYLEDVCVHHENYYSDIANLLPSLRKRPARTLTLHCERLERIGTVSAQFCTFYDDGICVDGTENDIQQIQSRLEESGVAATIYLRGTPEQVAAVEQKAATKSLASMDNVELVLGDTAPPCALCGTFPFQIALTLGHTWMGWPNYLKPDPQMLQELMAFAAQHTPSQDESL